VPERALWPRVFAGAVRAPTDDLARPIVWLVRDAGLQAAARKVYGSQDIDDQWVPLRPNSHCRGALFLRS